MPQLNGPISDKLRRIFSPKDKAWTPPRPPDSKPMPRAGVKGIELSKGNRRRGK